MTRSVQTELLKHLHIGPIVALQIKKKFPSIELDEIQGIANLVLVQQAGRFDVDRSPDGWDGFGPFLVQRVHWKTLNRCRLLMEKQAATILPETFLSDQGVWTADTVEVQDLLQAVLQKATSREKLLLELRYLKGKSLAEMARILGKSLSRVSQWVRMAVLRLRALRIGESTGTRKGDFRRIQEWRKHDPKGFAQAEKTRCQRLTRRTQENARWRFHSGLLPAWRKVRYLADHANQTVTGPFEGPRRALAHLGIHLAPGLGRGWRSVLLGWPGVAHTEAVILDALAQAGKTAKELAALLGERPESVRTAIQKMARKGMVDRVGKVSKGPPLGGVPEVIWQTSAAVLGTRGTVFRLALVNGKEAMGLLERKGYRAIRVEG